MIDNVIGTKTNISVLRFLTKFQNQFFSAEEISRETGAGLRNVYDSLSCLSYENIVSKKFLRGTIYYKFAIDKAINEIILRLFEEERKKFFIKSIHNYKIISEIESKIIKSAGQHIVDMILFGSVSKGTDTTKSDIDICVLIDKENDEIRQKIISTIYKIKSKQEIQIHVFSSADFVSSNQSNNSLIKNILRDGLSLKIGR